MLGPSPLWFVVGSTDSWVSGECSAGRRTPLNTDSLFFNTFPEEREQYLSRGKLIDY